ncbi:13610_t:CDS:2 [Ambispora gerdemannii]|uniref:13610_t:CDS:1 n=1 Tax=Ambispora gerdemannii TaxID=144530 RepID=A0A9N9GSF7_9GLOM|nr:13610_t:CDS:2 [Ambispora gerdemannii]
MGPMPGRRKDLNTGEREESPVPWHWFVAQRKVSNGKKREEFLPRHLLPIHISTKKFFTCLLVRIKRFLLDLLTLKNPLLTLITELSVIWSAKRLEHRRARRVPCAPMGPMPGRRKDLNTGEREESPVPWHWFVAQRKVSNGKKREEFLPCHLLPIHISTKNSLLAFLYASRGSRAISFFLQALMF